MSFQCNIQCVIYNIGFKLLKHSVPLYCYYTASELKFCLVWAIQKYIAPSYEVSWPERHIQLETQPSKHFNVHRGT